MTDDALIALIARLRDAPLTCPDCKDALLTAADALAAQAQRIAEQDAATTPPWAREQIEFLQSANEQFADLHDAAIARAKKAEARIDGYQGSRDHAIDLLTKALGVEADKMRAVEYYARLAAERIAELDALATRSTRRLVELSAPGSIGAFAARDHAIDRAEKAEAALAMARLPRFNDEPEEDCPCGSQCLHVGNCLRKCAAAIRAGEKP